MSARPPLTLVVAVGPGGVIGRGGGLPWHLPEDLKHFKRVTVGHAIVMGRRTWESIGRALPDRRSLVVTRQAGYVAEGAEVCASLEEALRRARQTDPEPRVIGGAGLYRAALPLATRLLLTEVDRPVEGDTFFPPLNEAEWREVERREGETEGVVFRTLERA